MGRKAFQMGKWTSNGLALGGKSSPLLISLKEERSARLKQVDMMARSWK